MEKHFSAVLDKVLKINKNITNVSFTLDVWKEKSNSRSYLGIAAQFLDDNLNMKCINPGIFHIESPKTHLKIQSITNGRYDTGIISKIKISIFCYR